VLAPIGPGVVIDRARAPLEEIEAVPRPALPASLVLRIGDRDRNPLAGARVTLLAGARQARSLAGARQERSAVTGGDGEVAFENLAAGRYGYRIAAPGRPEVRAAVALQLAAGATRVIELTLGDYD